MSFERGVAMCERLGIEPPKRDGDAVGDLVHMLEATLDRVELLEKQMAAVQEGVAYIEPITTDEGEGNEDSQD